MQKEQVTFVNYTSTKPDGTSEPFQYVSEKQLEAAQKEAAAAPDADRPTITVTKQQTFAVTRADSIDEILQVVPNADVALDYFNYGFTLAQHNVKRELMKDADWPGVDGVYDLVNDVQTPKEKRVADPLAASRRNLKALFAKFNPGAPEPTDDEINAVLAQFAGAAQPQTAA